MKLSPDFPHVKRIVDGVTYNTETSTLLHGRSTSTDQVQSTSHGSVPKPAFVQLYRTRLGRLFFVHRQIPVWVAAIRDYSLRDDVEPVSREAAKLWLTTHFPTSQETFFMTLEYVPSASQTETGAAVSLRLDSQLKERISMRSKVSDMSLNSLCVTYLQHGIVNSIERKPPTPDRYTTENGTTRLLTNEGQPGLDGISENGNEFELTRAIVAAEFREKGHTVPERLRQMLIDILSMNKSDENRELLLADIERWLRLYERANHTHL